MADSEIQCCDCQAVFTFTDGERDFYESRKLSAPRRCKSCRDKRKSTSGAPGGAREMHDAVCASCDVTCQVPFKPMEGRDVYCRDCFKR